MQKKYNFKPGDIITAYHSGWHIVIHVELRYITKSDLAYESMKNMKIGDEMPPLIHYKTIASASFKKSNSKAVKVCDASYCSIVVVGDIEKLRKKEIDRVNNGFDTLIEIFKRAKTSD